MKHKGWTIEKEPVGGGYIAYSDNYDPTPIEPNGVWGDPDNLVSGSTQEECIKLIDELEANKEKPAPEPEEEPLPAAAGKTSGGKLSGVVNPDLVNNEINSIVKYMTDEGFPLKHVQAVASIVYAFNESEQSEKEIFAFAHSIKKKYGVAA